MEVEVVGWGIMQEHVLSERMVKEWIGIKHGLGKVDFRAVTHIGRIKGRFLHDGGRT